MKFFSTSFLLLMSFFLSAQTTAPEFIAIGVQEHDKGNYDKAVQNYEKALEAEKGNEEAYYELGLTYMKMKKYDKSIECAEKLIKNKKDYVARGYHLKGMCQDYTGKHKDAVNSFKKGTKADQGYTTLYYSIAITSNAMNDVETAKEALEEGLSYNRYHLKSHYMLGLLMQNERAKSQLALYHYLVLVPTGQLANNAYNLILAQQKQGVEVKDDKSINITLNPIDEKDDFSSAEMMLSMLEASKSMDENKNKSDFQLFSENTKSFLQVLSELNEEKHKGFWWNFYVEFFSDLIKDDAMYETFTYYICQDIKSTEVETWLRKNPEKIEKLQDWVLNYDKTKKLK